MVMGESDGDHSFKRRAPEKMRQFDDKGDGDTDSDGKSTFKRQAAENARRPSDNDHGRNFSTSDQLSARMAAMVGDTNSRAGNSEEQSHISLAK